MPAGTAETIYRGGTVITMVDGHPQAEAVRSRAVEFLRLSCRSTSASWD